MALSAKQNTESLVIDTWIRSGKPVLTNLKKHTTVALAFGKPDTKMAQDTYLNKVMPKVTFEGIDKLKLDGRYFCFPYAKDVSAGAGVTRGAGMLAANTPSTTDPFDALKFQSRWYVINYRVSNDKMIELQGVKFALAGSFDSNVADAIMRQYFTDAAASVWATGAGTMPADGVLGSIRAQVSDGLTNAQRGASGGNESAYATFLGYDRTAATEFSATYQYKAGGALTVLNLEVAADAAYQNGATKVVIPMNAARFRKLEDTIRSTYGTNSLQLDEDLKGMGIGSGMQFMIGGITCYVDYDIPVGTWVTALDLPSISCGSDFGSVTLEKLPDVSVKFGTLLQGGFRDQMCVADPRKCTLIENLESL